MKDAPILQAENITKVFPGVRVLTRVNFELHKGEIHAVIGENGAGKTTLMNVLGGVLQPEEGNLYLEGETVAFRSVQEATQHGISVVFQELSLVENLTVAENIFANRQPVNAVGFVKKGELERQAQDMLDLLGVNLDPRSLVKNLPVSSRQVVEILKAMSYFPKILILDEPTSSLARAGVKELFKNIRRLKEEGISIIYITHHLSEIFEVADRVTILRDGQVIATKNIKEVTENDLVKLMVGREIENIYGDRAGGSVFDEEYFQVSGLSRKGMFENVSFSLRRGEILGISGLVGSGRTEMAETIFGMHKPDSGSIFLEEKKVHATCSRDCIKQGIGYLSEDRKSIGLFLILNVKQNVIAPRLEEHCRAGFLSESSIDQFCNKVVDDYRIVTSSLLQKVVNLSGGNQQKVLFSMWMGIRPKVLIIDEPTKGVDIGAKSDIYHKIRELAETRVGIILISSDLPEILGLSDRVLVMHQGEIAAELTGGDINEETIMKNATGISGNHATKVR